MSGWNSFRVTIEAIVRWSLTVKIGGATISVFWFLQLIKDELLPEDWGARLRLLNLLPHLPWYEWAIALLVVFLVGAIEGTLRWNRNEIASILGWTGTLQNDAFLLARRIRDFITKFIADNGEMPRIYPTNDDNERMRMNVAVSDWCNRFTHLFRATLSGEIEDNLNKIRASVPLDFTIIGVLKQPTLDPNSLMLLTGLVMAGGLSLTLKEKTTTTEPRGAAVRRN